MKVLLSKECLSKYELKEIIKRVHQLFEDYNSKKMWLNFICEKTLSSHKNEEVFLKQNISNPVMEATIRREQLMTELDSFNTKLKLLKTTFTREEKLIFKYCVEERKQEYELCTLLHRSVKTVRWIKKSCYIKIAIQFGLTEIV